MGKAHTTYLLIVLYRLEKAIVGYHVVNDWKECFVKERILEKGGPGN